MARLRVCKFCGHPNLADEFFCQGQKGSEICGAPLKGISLVEESEVAVASEEVGVLAGVVDGTVRELPDENRGERSYLECPWGELLIVDSIGIGREAAFCQEAERFAGYMTVSGVHARISFTDDGWVVRDLGSTNGTYLNGVQISANEKHKLSDEDQIHFSKSFRTVFRLGEARR